MSMAAESEISPQLEAEFLERYEQEKSRDSFEEDYIKRRESSLGAFLRELAAKSKLKRKLKVEKYPNLYRVKVGYGRVAQRDRARDF